MSPESSSTIKDQLVPLASVFLPSSTILITALGVAQTQGLKSGISALGLIISILWLLVNCGLYQRKFADRIFTELILTLLPGFFAFCWIVSLIIHLQNFLTSK